MKVVLFTNKPQIILHLLGIFSLLELTVTQDNYSELTCHTLLPFGGDLNSSVAPETWGWYVGVRGVTMLIWFFPTDANAVKSVEKRIRTPMGSELQ